MNLGGRWQISKIIRRDEEIPKSGDADFFIAILTVHEKFYWTVVDSLVAMAFLVYSSQTVHLSTTFIKKDIYKNIKFRIFLKLII